jgi:NAD-dependent DNA ligase
MALYSTMDDQTNDIESAVDDDGGGDDNVKSSLLYQQFKDLSLEIRKHDELYYGSLDATTRDGNNNDDGSSGTTILSDDEFDALVRREEELEENHPDLLRTWQLESGLGKAATRSGRVGANNNETSSLGSTNNNVARLKRTHLTPMLSLDNVHSEEQLLGWLKRVVKAATTEEIEAEKPPSMVTIVTEPKLDGVSLSLRYEASHASDTTTTLDLKWASTRGDGIIGQDVTAAAKQIPGIPNHIHLPLSSLEESSSLRGSDSIAVEVRGEVVLPRSEFLLIKAAAHQQIMEREEEKERADGRTIASDNKNYTDTTNENTESMEALNATSPSIVSFVNPRNAASGIMLRKESDDPEEQSESKKLRSLLRFYAYDLSGLEKLEKLKKRGGAVSELDGIKIRDQLSEWHFSLALPVAITNIEWKNIHDEDTNDTTDPKSENNESSSESKPSWDDWFQETIAQDQIQPIMEYFSALEKHRERLQEEEASSTTQKSGKDSSQASTNYEWGDFDVDGCVHKVTQASMRSSMGYSTKSPKWATAHKFPAQSSVARLLDVIVQVGRTGALTPVAVLEPTEVGGVTIQRATLHNFGHMQEILGSGSNHQSGDDDENEKTNVAARIPKYEPVLVQRAGDVIPQVVRRIHQSHSNNVDDSSTTWISLDPPDKCPFCASPVSYESSSSSSTSVGQVVRCTGPPLLCPPRAVTSLKHAFSRDALDLTGLSEGRIQQLMDAGLLKYPSDVFRLGDAQWEILEAIPGWGERSCQNLKESSESVASKGITLGRFVYSLGIRHLGKHTSELVASCHGSVGAFFEALDSASQHHQSKTELQDASDGQTEGTEESISTLHPPNHPFPRLENKLGIGPVVVDSLLAFSQTKELTDAAKALAESLNILEQDVVVEEEEEEDPSEISNSNRPWKGFRVVFTGSLGGVDGLTRSRAQEIAKQLGAKATPGSVSKSTDLVVFGDKGGKKLTQAKELGISTMEAETFVKLATELGFLDAEDR